MDYFISYKDFVYNHTKSSIPRAKEFAAHTHNKYEILYFISGDADCIIGNMRRKLKPGEMVIIPSLYVHYIDIVGTVPYERIVLNFQQTDVNSEMLRQAFFSPEIIDTSKFPMISEVFLRLMRYSKIFSEEENKILFYNIMTELLYLIHNALKSENVVDSFDNYGKTMQKAINYINKHLFEPTDIQKLCQELYISRTYFHKIFNHALGMSPMKYIKTRRLIAAREMIRLGEKPTNVSKKVGFNDYTAFFRSYKTYFGYTPTDTEAE